VALTVVLASAARSVKAPTPRARSKARVPPAKRFTSEAPTTASSVLPAAMPSDVATDPAVVRLARKAPSSTAGEARSPRISSAASAIPAGGQTAVALAWTKARLSPSFAVRK